VGAGRLPTPWYCWKFCSQDLKAFGCTFKPGARPEDKLPGAAAAPPAARASECFPAAAEDSVVLAPGSFLCAGVYDQAHKQCHKLTEKDFKAAFQKELDAFLDASSSPFA
jgi:hypothetical protein